ncbi:serine hydrolase domain-containing protein [Desulfovibrio inopinatus]|uniref:serine hydrolase domain-containing protein n=1 Tax=Desulfovibrio inopinatus TaxID=102109 RepID=UPI00040BABE8|nr:serine hydrolase domain-containing protein [Desulfovibrio inopinatus]
MEPKLTAVCDEILAGATSDPTRVPGVVAMATNRSETVYEGAYGKRMLGGKEAMSVDTVFGIFSCTKALTGTVIMQLVEQGMLDLDVPAKEYCPELGDVMVLDGFDDLGEPRLRPPKQPVTTRNLLLHTAGFGYDFFSESYHRLYQKDDIPGIILCRKVSIQMPLLFDPGERWEYGVNMDWAGQVAECITGKRLGELMQLGIFDPLGMQDTGFTMSDSMRERRAVLHQRDAEGILTPLPDLTLPDDPEVHMGGHGLYSTVGDYMRFIRMLLNDGKGEHGRVLAAETVQKMSLNGLGTLKVRPFISADPLLTNSCEVFPGMPKSWGYTFMINDEPAPTGRPAGSLAWAGLANLYYWIDRLNGLGGFWATQILPFADPPSYEGYLGFETAVYDNWQEKS